MENKKQRLMVDKMAEMTLNSLRSPKETWKKYKKQHKESLLPQSIDRYIYLMENSYMKDGIIDWNGCIIDESWEEYKEKVGYYKRHPERKEESQRFTKEVIQWGIGN